MYSRLLAKTMTNWRFWTVVRQKTEFLRMKRQTDRSETPKMVELGTDDVQIHAGAIPKGSLKWTNDKWQAKQKGMFFSSMLFLPFKPTFPNTSNCEHGSLYKKIIEIQKDVTFEFRRWCRGKLVLFDGFRCGNARRSYYDHRFPSLETVNVSCTSALSSMGARGKLQSSIIVKDAEVLLIL